MLDNKPIMAIEVKLSDESISKSLVYFKKKFPDVQAFQISLKGKKDFIGDHQIRVMPALMFLRDLV